MSYPTRLGFVAALWSALAAGQTFAADVAPPSGVVNLAASASADVVQDVMQVVFSISRDGKDAVAVQTALKQALDAALAEARRVAKPGQLDVDTGNFSLFPRYSPKAEMNGWQGSAELRVEGRDMTAIGQLTGRISSMTIASVAHTLSREQRELAEGRVAAQAIERFRAKAADYAKQFGYASYTLREVNVNATQQRDGVVPMERKATMASMSSAGYELPSQAGKSVVTVSVSGNVQMK